jgi:hypothetical protein
MVSIMSTSITVVGEGDDGRLFTGVKADVE